MSQNQVHQAAAGNQEDMQVEDNLLFEGPDESVFEDTPKKNQFVFGPSKEPASYTLPPPKFPTVNPMKSGASAASTAASESFTGPAKPPPTNAALDQGAAAAFIASIREEEEADVLNVYHNH